MLNYCTLFDRNYLSIGLVMYDSLLRHCSEFHLYIFAFDDYCVDILVKLKLEHVSVISLSEFEDEELLKIKNERSIAEYCWTCTPSIVWYVLNNYDVNHCTYLDADLLFLSDPKILYTELGNKSVLITEHRYTRPERIILEAGIFNVQYVTFKNNEEGKNVCLWWRNKCIEWCYDRFEDGKFGDQKYLDQWPDLFPQVHILQNLGGGIATWNVDQYDFRYIKGKLIAKEKRSSKRFIPVFYHYHGVRFYDNNIVFLSRDFLSKKVKQILYFTYISKILTKENFLKKFDNRYSSVVKKRKSDKLPMTNRDKFYLYRKELYNILKERDIFNSIKRFKNLFNSFRRNNYYRING
ncbi:MAG: glycosyl transferase [Flavobacteriia bacterium]|nr:glycosyl transferase [Flavobacteriia bacterium]